MSEAIPSLLTYAIIAVVIIVIGIYYRFRKYRHKVETLRNIIKIAYSMDHDLPAKISRCNSVNSYSEKRQLPMAIYLEQTGILDAFVSSTGPTTRQNLYERSTIGRLGSRNAYIEELEFTLANEDKPNRRFYQRLVGLHDLVLENLPREALEEAAEKVYFLELNMLHDYYEAVRRGAFLTYDPGNVDVEAKETFEFMKMVLNLHYKNYQSHTPQDEHYNPDAFLKELTRKE
jgi:hypothetical protein